MNWSDRKPFEPIPEIKLSMNGTGLGVTMGADAALVAAETPEDSRHIIRSADTCDLSTPALEPLRGLIARALKDRSEIDILLSQAREEYAGATRVYDEWADGFFGKHLRPFRFAQIKKAVETARERIAVLEKERGEIVVKANLEFPEGLIPLFERACASFSTMAEFSKIWDVVAETAGGETQIERHEVSFSLQPHPVLPCRWKVPCLGNYNGGTLHIYPGFLLYVVSTLDFAVIDLGTLSVEIGAEPSGGSGAILNLSTPSGLNERYLVEARAAAESFARDIGAVIALCRR
jgi:hypothetical protein